MTQVGEAHHVGHLNACIWLHCFASGTNSGFAIRSVTVSLKISIKRRVNAYNTSRLDCSSQMGFFIESQRSFSICAIGPLGFYFQPSHEELLKHLSPELIIVFGGSTTSVLLEIFKEKILLFLGRPCFSHLIFYLSVR
jgi:hypothetical protein